MNMAQESSVLISLQQLLDEEQARQKAELAEQAARLANEREERRSILAAEAERAERAAQQAREQDLRLEAIREAELIKARLTAEAEVERTRQQAEAERARLLASHELTVETARWQAHSRLLVAALGTLLTGAIAIWALVIIPGQRRADQAYSHLQQQHASFAEQASQRESALARQVRGLGEELKRAHIELAAAAAASAPKVVLPIAWRPKRARPAVSNVRNPACTCLDSDPLCECMK